MLNIDFHPSLKLLSSTSRLERLSGKLELQAPGAEVDCVEAIQILAREHTDPDLGKRLTLAKEVCGNFGPETPRRIFFALSDSDTAFRTTNENFLAPGTRSFDQDVVFPTVSAFLIEKRLEDLFDWLQRTQSDLNPAIRIATFHLLFLQIYPFKAYNHLISLFILETLLKSQGYGFLEQRPLAIEFERHSTNYYQSLRQAERSLFDTWQTLNVWLEFFCESLANTATKVLSIAEEKRNISRLTGSQRRILESIQLSGTQTREQISLQIGMNINTVKYNLKALTEAGFLVRIGGGRSTAYQARHFGQRL